jgi:DNA polymerase-3 subunit gamma/tau
MSLATKYRPQKLDDVLGQRAVTDSIKKILGRSTVPKTWLFVGPSGCGKTTIARILAAHFIGGSLTLANFIEVDAAVNAGAEDSRGLTIKANYKALAASPIKVFLIDEVHNLSKKAFDALLKSTEEPPEHVYWLLCTTEPSKIPETLNTRCVKFNLKPVGEVAIFDLIIKVTEAEKLQVLPEVLELIAENSKGSPRQALANLEICADAKNAGEARDLLRTASELKGPVDLAKLIMTRRGKWVDVISILNSKGMEGLDGETIRIVIINYVAGAVMRAKSNEEAARLMSIMECFSTPYVTSDKLAPLLLSVGAAMGLDKNLGI